MINDYIAKGEYFADARKWYYNKYVAQVAHRSIFLGVCSVLLLLILVLVMNIQSLLPIVRSLKYIISVPVATNQTAEVVHAQDVADNPLQSVLIIMIKDYVKRREQYDYAALATQIKYMHNTSSRTIFTQFYNYLNIDNPESPILRYQNEARRIINVTNVHFLNDSYAEVSFTSAAVTNDGKSFENLSWIATLRFNSDPINVSSSAKSKFNFTITDYKLKLVGDSNVKN
jgi:type IV secretion system protein VirB8